MQNSGSGIAKTIIAILAIVCIALAIVFVVKNKPECSSPSAGYDSSENNYDNSNYGSYTSGGDLVFDDNSTEEMDTIPNDNTVSSADR